MRIKSAALPLALVLAAGTSSLGQAATRKAPVGTPKVHATTTPPVNGAPNLGTGTISYDNNVPFARVGTLGGTVGNLFNTAVDPHGVSTASFRVAGNYETSVVMTIWDQNPGSFMVLQRQLVAGVPSSATATMGTVMAPLSMAIAAHTGAFVGGIRNSDYAACNGDTGLNSTCDGVALTMGGVDPGMGFHAIRVPFNSTMFVPTVTMVAGAGTAFGTQNAIFRVTGDNLPVELMSFGVE